MPPKSDLLLKALVEPIGGCGGGGTLLIDLARKCCLMAAPR